MNTKKFTVQPDGLIKGGWASYELMLNGDINYEAEIEARFVGTKKYSGTYKAGLDAIMSASYDSVGEKKQIEQLEFEVTKREGTLSTVAVTLIGQNITGTLLVETKDMVIEIMSGEFHGKVSGFNITLKLS